jgi:hypothetical protein
VASSKTKWIAAVAALSASLLAGGVAAAQADADAPACVHGKGKGMGIGAPSRNHKGHGAENGWPHGCKDKDDNPGGGSDNPGVGSENPGGEVGGSDNNGTVTVDADADVNLPDAGDLAEGVLGALTPAAVTAVGQTLETTELVKNDLSAIVGLLDSATTGATTLDAGSVDAGVNVARDGAAATINVIGAMSGVTSLAGQLAESTFGIVGGSTTGVTGLIAGMLFVS